MGDCMAIWPAVKVPGVPGKEGGGGATGSDTDNRRLCESEDKGGFGPAPGVPYWIKAPAAGRTRNPTVAYRSGIKGRRRRLANRQISGRGRGPVGGTLMPLRNLAGGGLNGWCTGRGGSVAPYCAWTCRWEIDCTMGIASEEHLPTEKTPSFTRRDHEGSPRAGQRSRGRLFPRVERPPRAPMCARPGSFPTAPGRRHPFPRADRCPLRHGSSCPSHDAGCCGRDTGAAGVHRGRVPW